MKGNDVFFHVIIISFIVIDVEALLTEKNSGVYLMSKQWSKLMIINTEDAGHNLEIFEKWQNFTFTQNILGVLV